MRHLLLAALLGLASSQAFASYQTGVFAYDCNFGGKKKEGTRCHVEGLFALPPGPTPNATMNISCSGEDFDFDAAVASASLISTQLTIVGSQTGQLGSPAADVVVPEFVNPPGEYSATIRLRFGPETVATLPGQCEIRASETAR